MTTRDDYAERLARLRRIVAETTDGTLTWADALERYGLPPTIEEIERGPIEGDDS